MDVKLDFYSRRKVIKEKMTLTCHAASDNNGAL